jgi:CheY-like chemotaxis protein
VQTVKTLPVSLAKKQNRLHIFAALKSMPQHQKFILIADDDQEDLELLSEVILQLEADTKLHTVNNGSFVMDFLEQAKDEELPSLIVLDYNMPNMNGAEVLEQLCNDSRYQNIPKIIWSTSNNSNYIKECLEKGATSYFVKPATHKNLQEQAAQMLRLCA